MKIALLSTCAVAVPPKGYGGTEVVTAELAKMLTRNGHHVTVFATGDSRPAGKLRYRFAKPIWPPNDEAERQHATFAWQEITAAGSFDIVHAQQLPSLAVETRHSTPTVITVHCDRDPRWGESHRSSDDVSFVAISERQRTLNPDVPFSDVVHHGLHPDLYPYSPNASDYCAFLGRLAPEKGVHDALDATRIAGVPLRIGGAPHWLNRDYFAAEVRPRLDEAGSRATWLGEVTHGPKLDLLRGARALLFPIDWEEPFGLVMIEAMLVGTPVIAYSRGSVPEVVEDGVTGFVVRNVDEMAARIRALASFDRQRCRARAEERWSSMRMARDYEKVYEEALRGRKRPHRFDSGVDQMEDRGEDELARTGTE
jgi:glycosyltransferase involved in cell wall biosynthesis